MATYLLVGGAWLGGWAWKRVATELRSGGYTVYAVTLTGLGERSHLASPETNLDTHITDIVNVIEYEDLTDVILVGHSYAGIVVEGVADRVPDRLSQLVYLDSGPMGDGVAHLDFYEPEAREQVERQVNEAGDGWRLPFPGFEALAMSASLAGLDDEDRRLMSMKATPQPYQTYTQPLRLTNTFAGEYGRVLILCTDGGFSIEQVREMIAAGVPAFQALGAPDWRFHEIATGHWPMFSEPAELATVLHSLA